MKSMCLIKVLMRKYGKIWIFVTENNLYKNQTVNTMEIIKKY